MKKKTLKLNLKTIRNLQETDLAQIAGAEPSCPGGTGPCPSNSGCPVRFQI